MNLEILKEVCHKCSVKTILELYGLHLDWLGILNKKYLDISNRFQCES